MARPKEFEPTDVVAAAMHTFWTKGYNDTSMRDLVASTGVNPYGIYSVFGDKQGLFLDVLDHYRRTVTQRIRKALEGPENGIVAIRRAFDEVLSIISLHMKHKGCLMCVTAVEVAPFDPKAAKKVKANMSELRDGFVKSVEVAQQHGEIASEEDARSLGEYLMATVFAVAVLARAGESQSFLRRYIETALRRI